MDNVKTYKIVNTNRRSYFIDGYGWLGQNQECVTNIKPSPSRGLSIDEIGFKDTQKEEIVKTNIPNMSWTDKKIKKWIEENAPDVIYDIRNDTKNDAFLRLKYKGYI